MADLLVIVPSRGRPESVARVAQAWRATGAYADAQLVFAIDADDPRRGEYFTSWWDRAGSGPEEVVFLHEMSAWKPMVHKLNECAVGALSVTDHWPAIAFMGDDHLPRTPGWAGRYVAELRELGTGIVYGDDRIQGEKLPTQWAMTSDIVRALGRMVPADVEHLYCDNAIGVLGQAAECIRYLPDVVIEHCHPAAGRGAWDAGYERVNSRAQYAKDHASFMAWVNNQMAADVATVRALREVPCQT